MLPHRAVELKNGEGKRFKVKGKRIKMNMGKAENVQQVVEVYYLDEISVINKPMLCRNVKSNVVGRNPRCTI